MLGNPKNVFWEAFLLAVIVFAIGFLLGSAFEENRLEDINEFYSKSEVSLMDVLALNSLTEVEDSSCGMLTASNIEFADKIYEEARLLERYDASERLSDNFKLAHQRYDLLRTFLWINSMKIEEKCENDFSSVVYLYEYETDDLTKKATQSVWSKILFDLKQKKGNEIVLIPIAGDTDLSSLNSLKERFNISELPVVIVNNEHVIRELGTVEDLEAYVK